MRAGGGERESENVRQTALSMEANSRLNPMTLSWNRESDAQPTELPRHPQKVYFNKVLIISCDLLNTVLKGKNRTAMWMQNGGMCIGCHPCDSWWPRSCAGCSAEHHGTASYRRARVKCSCHKTNKQTKGLKETLGAAGYICYLDYDDGILGICIMSKFIKPYTLNTCSFLYQS